MLVRTGAPVAAMLCTFLSISLTVPLLPYISQTETKDETGGNLDIFFLRRMLRAHTNKEPAV